MTAASLPLAPSAAVIYAPPPANDEPAPAGDGSVKRRRKRNRKRRKNKKKGSLSSAADDGAAGEDDDDESEEDDVPETELIMAAPTTAGIVPEFAMERTLAIVKPDAMSAPGHLDAIRARIIATADTASPLVIIRERSLHLSTGLAQHFYAEHVERPFYSELVTWMASGPVYIFELEGPGAIASWRTLIGPTNSEKARESAPESIRALFGKDGCENAVHGSDSAASADREIALLFGYEAPGKTDPAADEVAAELSSAVQSSAESESNTSAESVTVEPALFAEQTNPSGTNVAIAANTPATCALLGATNSDLVAENGLVAENDSVAENVLVESDSAVKETNGIEFESTAVTKESVCESTANIGIEPKVDEQAINSYRTMESATFEIIESELAAGDDRQTGDALASVPESSDDDTHQDGAETPLEPETPVDVNEELASPSSFIVAAAPVTDKAVNAKSSVASLVRSEMSSGRSSPKILNNDRNSLGLGKPVSSSGEIERTLAIIKPDAYIAGHLNTIIKRIREAGFAIVEEKEFKMPKIRVEELYHEHKNKSHFHELALFMASGQICALVLEREDAVRVWLDLIGPTNSAKARETAPDSLRARYGKDGLKNAVHGSASIDVAWAEIEFVMGRKAKMPRAGAGRSSPNVTVKEATASKTPTTARRRLSLFVPPADPKSPTAFATTPRLNVLATPKTKVIPEVKAKSRVMSVSAAPKAPVVSAIAKPTTLTTRRVSVAVTSSGYGVRPVIPASTTHALSGSDRGTPSPTVAKAVKTGGMFSAVRKAVSSVSSGLVKKASAGTSPNPKPVGHETAGKTAKS